MAGPWEVAEAEAPQQVSPLREVPVAFNDLRIWSRVLGIVNSACVADDLARAYRDMNETGRPSKITRATEEALNRVNGYLAEATRTDYLEDLDAPE